MRKKAVFVGVPIVIATMVLWSLACDSLDVNLGEIEYTNSVRIGYLSPITETRAMSESRYLAAFMAAEEINEAGGVLGRDIELVPRNDGGSKVIGVAAARQLHEEGIDIIIGPGRSSVVLEIAPQVTIPNGMLVISYAATSPLISTLADSGLVWRTSPSDILQGDIGADYCYNTLSKTTVGILVLENPWAFGLADAFGASFESLGGTVTNYVIYPQLLGSEVSSYDYSPHLDTLFSGQPAMVYLVCFGRDGAGITNDIVAGNYIDDGYDPFFFSCDGLHTQDFIVNGHPEILMGMRGTVPGSDEEDPDNILFLENYNRRFGIAPPNYSQHAYDALYLVAYGILRANSANPIDIAAELRVVSGGDPGVQGTVISLQEFARAKNILAGGGDINYNGVSGEIDFDDNGDPTSGTYLIWNVANSQFGVETYVSFP